MNRSDLDAVAAEFRRLEARISELEEALEPFAAQMGNAHTTQKELAAIENAARVLRKGE